MQIQIQIQIQIYTKYKGFEGKKRAKVKQILLHTRQILTGRMGQGHAEVRRICSNLTKQYFKMFLNLTEQYFKICQI